MGDASPVTDPTRAAAILRGIAFFQDMGPEVMRNVAESAEFVTKKAGTVVFFQGGPPDSCYVLLSGEIGIFINKDITADQDVMNRPSPQAQAAHAPQTPSDPSSPASPIGAGAIWGAVGAAGKMKRVTSKHRFRALGDRVRSLGPGSLIGELGLMNDKPRTASLQCSEDCEFLMISRASFELALKQEMLRTSDDKVRFLMAHLPGLSKLPTPKPGSADLHASYYFKKTLYPKGHVFFDQGGAADRAIYVVSQGYVELFRSLDRLDQMFFAGRQPMMERPSSMTKLPKLRLKLTQQPTASWNSRSAGTLVTGGVFGSLASDDTSPFTVVVSSSSCEVWQIAGPDLERMPKALLAKVQEFLATANEWRLKMFQFYSGSSPPGMKLLNKSPSLPQMSLTTA